jgi:DNA-binding MarR family transcriptional regulator
MINNIKLVQYIKDISGSIPEIKPLDSSVLKRLPFFIKDTYALHLITLLNHQFVLATSKGPLEITPGQLEMQANLIRQSANEDVAFEFQMLPAFLRQRLVQKSIAFIVPGTHLFLPFMIMDFRSKTRNITYQINNEPGSLSMPAQLVLLYNLQCSNIDNMTSGDLSTRFNYSPMTLSRVFTEMTQKGLCEINRDGVKKRIKFMKRGLALWETARPYLQSPIITTKIIAHDNTIQVPHYNAGMTALSEYTSLADDPTPTVALFKQDWHSLLKSNHIIEQPYEDEQSIRVEIWGYNPTILVNHDGKSVDRLSLYLTCNESKDERVQTALEELLENIQWSKE